MIDHLIKERNTNTEIKEKKSEENIEKLNGKVIKEIKEEEVGVEMMIIQMINIQINLMTLIVQIDQMILTIPEIFLLMVKMILVITMMIQTVLINKTQLRE